MIALNIEEMGPFTSMLFVGEIFDSFLMEEAVIVTFNEFTINGRIRPAYLNQEETQEYGDEVFSLWKVIKPYCFSLIKGTRLPEKFHIVLKLCSREVGQFIESGNLGISQDQICGLYLNIRYESGQLTCVTGTSVNFFTMDKSLDFQWDEAVQNFFKQHKIAFTKQ